MKPNTESLKLTVQETLDGLFSEQLIPFELTAHEVNDQGLGDYVVPFCDRRIHSVRFSWKDGDGSSIRDVIRAVVLARTKRISGPLATSWRAATQPK